MMSADVTAQVKESGLALGLFGDALERYAVPIEYLHHAQYFGTAGCKRGKSVGAAADQAGRILALT